MAKSSDYRKNQILAIVLCLCLAVTVMSPLSALAQNRGKIVRVGWYESAYHRTDQFGRRSGYGYEYQQRIATFTGWTYEYVEGSWSELFEKLVAGEIDLLSDVSYTAERAEKILYSAQEMGSEDYHVFISPDNTEIRPDDFTTFDDKIVGVNKNSIQEKLFIEWAKNHQVKPVVKELTEKTPELLEMLSRGEIDALVTLDTYGNSADVLPICKVGSADSFFGVNSRRPDIKKELDVAMNRITEDNRYYNQQMSEKYANTGRILGFLTTDELDWYNEHGTIRVGYRTGYLPFCDTNAEKNTVTGALADFLEYAKTCEKNAELSFETKPYDSMDDAIAALINEEIDCIFPTCLSAYDGEKEGLIITDPLLDTQMYAVVRTGDRVVLSHEQEMTVAILNGSRNYLTFLMDYFPDWKIAYFDDEISALRAVSSGSADCVLVSNYRLNLISRLCEEYKLSPITTGEVMNLSFALRRDDDRLYSILNKISRLIPTHMVNASLTSYSYLEDKVTFGAFIKDNLFTVLFVLMVVAIIILVLLLRGIQAEQKALRERQLITAVELDNLTKLYNRNFFYEYANRIHKEEPEPQMDVIVLNIEQFHSVNELHGRDFGDKVLQAVGDEIRKLLEKARGIACRYEGDLFYVFCEQQDDYAEVMNRFQNRISSRFPDANIRLRMGVSLWQEGVEPAVLFDRAKTASNIVRNSKRHLMIYDEKMRVKEELDQRLINDLGRALREKEFKVYYQPKYNIQCDPPSFDSAEALIRWQHPDLGLISPADFIPLFESNGQISEIDKYVWEEAARQIAEWRDRFGVTVPISVNLSRVDALDPGLEKNLDDLLAAFSLDSKCLHLEVTESAYTEDAAQLSQIIGKLRSKGYKIEMDDFGSGYSSLNMLSSVPIDVLKMDMAFIRNIEHSEKDIRLVEIIINIAKNLKVPVIAEGVETESQLKLLKDLGCTLVQGYYFSKPLPNKDFEEAYLTPNPVFAS